MSASLTVEASLPFYAHHVRGAVFGVLIGDALGVPYEFHAPEELPPKHLIDMTPPKGFRRAHAGVPPGTWSDDGALMLALLDSLTTVTPFTVDDFAQRMLAWRRDGKYTPDGVVFDVGIQTSTALQRIAKGTPAAQAGPVGERDNGSGALMRVLPVAFMATSDAEAVRLARLQGLPTHGHLWSQLACALYVLVARELLAGQPFDAAYERACAALPAFLKPDEAQVFSTLLAGRTPGRGSGFVLDSLWSAFDCLAATSSFEDAVRSAIALGHDTDTTACIAGGLAGALYGPQGIPERWRQALRGRGLVDAALAAIALDVGDACDDALKRAEYNDAGRVMLFHTTTRERAQSILAEGFRNGRLSGVEEAVGRGVSLALEAVGILHEVEGDAIIEIEVPREVNLREYFVVEDGMPVWELLVPADVVTAWPRRLKGQVRP
ncbi:ADP-ribosylglycohydrolase family protein [Variovorax rhizosphaerae]|uniref:ADP-ribosylglycohydrolase family protein n=1 Tax=Variovorax rhizosphaerae TaxID=1836200 RepID=A0ABU8WQ23_9BURK